MAARRASSASHFATKRSTTPSPGVPGRASSVRRARPRQPVLPAAPQGGILSLVPWSDHYTVPPPTIKGSGGVLIDNTGDGYADAIGYDTTGDGVVDALDTNGDGVIDTAIILIPAPTTSHAHSAGNDHAKAASGQGINSQQVTDGHRRSTVQIPLDDYLSDDDQQVAWVSEVAGQIHQMIDTDGDGQISKLELLAAMVRNHTVNNFVLPGFDSSRALSDEKSFDAVSATFDAIGGGKKYIGRTEFVQHFCKLKCTSKDKKGHDEQIRATFDLIDADGKGSFSNFDLLGALQRFDVVASLLMPGVDRKSILREEKCFDAANAVWDSMARGQRRVAFLDFAAHLQRPKSQDAQPKTLQQPAQRPLTTPDLDSVSRFQPQSVAPTPTLLQSLRQNAGADSKKRKPHSDRPRNEKYVLIIAPGFGRELNPAQAALVHRAGFQVQYVEVPNPESPSFPMMAYLPHVKEAIDTYRPDVLVSASKGGAYVVALWRMGSWSGPTVMINAHPQLTEIPKGTSTVISHGSNDELYPRSRSDLEKIVATGSENKRFLYYTANSGRFSGGFTRVGDQHNQASLLMHDCLPRLIDAATCESGPEIHMIASWLQRLSPQRNQAEPGLSYCPEQLRNSWVSHGHMGMDAKKLYEVSAYSEEFRKVATIFKAAPMEPASYLGITDVEWDRTRILSVQRVENGLLEQSENAYYECLRRSIEDQGLTFEPGVHTRWAFHGTDQIESIIEDPMTGFQPLACGTRLGSLWGSGTYFARDARYVVDGNFCSPASDGTRQMLLCLLMTGMPCLGDPEHHGVLPFRQKPHRYNSSVDSLSSPEIFIMQHPGAAYPAYLITFA